MRESEEAEGMINLCIPHLVVEPIVSKLSTKLWFSMVEKEATQENREAIEGKVQNIVVPVRAILGKTSITVNDFIEIQIGDVMTLDSNVNSGLEVLVGEHLKFYAKPE